MRVCGQVAWPVDAALRPEGKPGPLVRTLASHQAYYRAGPGPGSSRRCSRPGRPPATSTLGAGVGRRPGAAGLARGRAAEAVDRTCGRCAAGSSTRCRRTSADREIKRGPGGLRDIEFAVQLLQLVHGRGDESLRSAARWPRCGPGRRRLRRPRRRRGARPRRTASCATVEHRLQLQRLRRTHRCPTTDGRPALAGPRDRLPARRPRRRGRPSSTPSGSPHAARGPPAAREAVLPAAAARRSPGCRATQLRLTPGAAGARLEVARLRRPGRRAAAPPGAHRRGVPARGDPAHAAAGAAARVRRRARAGPRAARLPAGVRQARRHALVPAAAARRGPGRRCGWPGCSASPATSPTCWPATPEALRLLADDAELAPAAGAPRCERPRRRPRRPGTTTRPPAIARGPGAAPPGAVPDRRRRPARPARRRPPSAQAARPTSAAADRRRPRSDAAAAGRRGVAGAPLPTCGSRSSAWAGSAAARLSYGSDADVLFVYEPPPGAAEEDAAAAAHAVAEELRRLLAAAGARPAAAASTPTCARRAGRARWSAASAAYAAVLRALVAGRGRRRRCCGPVRWPATPSWGGEFVALADPLRYPAGGLTASRSPRSAGSRPGWTTERLPRGRRPGHPHQARPGRAGRRRVDRAAAAAAARRDRLPALRTHPHPRALAAARDAGLIDRRRRRGAGRRPGGSRPGSATR